MTTSSERFPSTAPLIAALPDSPDRPLWSVMIPVYNCAAFLCEALQSVLAQDMGAQAMQIQVVDDASTDADVEALVLEIGAGRVEYFRQAENVGSLRNFETCINHARGHLVHLLHGDDRVLLGFYQKLTSLFEKYPLVGAAFSHHAFIDESGIRRYTPPLVDPAEGLLDNWLLRIAQQVYTQYVAIAVRRSVYEKLGGFYGTSYGEDWEMWVRIARHYPFAYSPELLAEYRVHSGSISWEKARSGQIISDLSRVIKRIEKHLPQHERARISRIARKYYASYNIDVAYEVFQETGNWTLAYAQVKRSLSMSNHPSIYYKLLNINLKIVRSKLK
ncbi:glycosyltransferase family 2 protein [uncultured Hymenobacter sp.]|uniref:glycosyltransferase family 2 protein n=1 Tax=uncultured Hymenobacter sp. TaxID=170016 RepID=UPI0035CB1DCC